MLLKNKIQASGWTIFKAHFASCLQLAGFSAAPSVWELATGSDAGFHCIKSNETLGADISTNQPIQRCVWRQGFDLKCTRTENYTTHRKKSLLPWLFLPHSINRQASAHRPFSLFFQALLQAQRGARTSINFRHLSLPVAWARLQQTKTD